MGLEVRRSRDVLWVVRLGDPNPVRITRNVLTKKSHLCLKESMFDAHVRPGEHARNLFEVAAEESVSAANERLEGNRLTILV